MMAFVFQTETECVCIQVIFDHEISTANLRNILSQMNGCKFRDWIWGELIMTISRVLYSTCVVGAEILSETFNTLDNVPSKKSRKHYYGRVIVGLLGLSSTGDPRRWFDACRNGGSQTLCF